MPQNYRLTTIAGFHILESPYKNLEVTSKSQAIAIILQDILGRPSVTSLGSLSQIFQEILDHPDLPDFTKDETGLDLRGLLRPFLKANIRRDTSSK